jgi:hypothetical protein
MVELPVVHLCHFYDGYPLCWPMDQDGEFKGSYKENEVTCPLCISIDKGEE